MLAPLTLCSGAPGVHNDVAALLKWIERMLKGQLSTSDTGKLLGLILRERSRYVREPSRPSILLWLACRTS